MIQHSFAVYDLQEVSKYLSTPQIAEQLTKSRAVFIQIFASRMDITLLKQLNGSIRKAIPCAIIVGTTTSGEIHEGKSLNHSTVISITYFEHSDVRVFAVSCPKGFETESGIELSDNIKAAFSSDIKGVLLLSTAQTMDGGKLLNGMRNQFGDFPLFGAGAGSYENNHISCIFYNEELYTEGVIAVVFSGNDLYIEAYTYTGWQALSKEMTATEVEKGDNLIIKKIDDVPAASIYERYLGICNDENFFLNSIEFPIIVLRNGIELTRIPVACEDDGSLCLVADIREGEKIRLAYGSPESIIINAFKIQTALRKFGPQGIFLYSCNCRQIFLQDSVQMETEPFEAIAPTSGFYTYGEFYGRSRNINLLNATMVAVGFREGESKRDIQSLIPEIPAQKPKQLELTSRLVRFIEVVVSELEDSNSELQVLLEKDKLTQLYNRGKIDSLFLQEIKTAKEKDSCLSVILLDIDHFKQVNDQYGHLIGDCVLKQVADTLQSRIRTGDIVGRWGGEEFMILLPDTGLNMATTIAERIREVIADSSFGEVGKLTASFGVVRVEKWEDDIQVYKRVDAELYKAKSSGRNKVVSNAELL